VKWYVNQMSGYSLHRVKIKDTRNYLLDKLDYVLPSLLHKVQESGRDDERNIHWHACSTQDVESLAFHFAWHPFSVEVNIALVDVDIKPNIYVRPPGLKSSS